MSKSSTEQRPTRLKGYEDNDVLEILAQVLLDKPELTVTAAIKSLGIKDSPSVKRLRDKHQALIEARLALANAADNGRVIKFPAGASAAPFAKDLSTTPNQPKPLVAGNDQQPAGKPVAPTADSPAVRKRVRDEMAAANMPSAPFSAAVALPDQFFETGGAGMKMWLSALEMQQMMWFEMMRTLPMAAALRSQMLACEWTMAAYRHAPKKLKT